MGKATHERELRSRRYSRIGFAAPLLALATIITACGGAVAPAPAPTPTATPETSPAVGAATTSPATPTAAAIAGPAFLSTPLKDVRTGESFSIGAFPGKVVLVIAMAVW